MKAKLRNRIILYTVLIVGAVIFIYPFLWMLSTSLKTDIQVASFPPVWIPSPIRIKNYADALTEIPYLHYSLNSLICVIFAMLGEFISAPAIGYAFSKLKWRGRDKIFILVLATMMLPFQITMIPLYTMYVKIHWINTFLPLVVPDFFGRAFFIFLMRQFFLGIPEEILEAGRIDGASEFRIYTTLVIPLSKAAITSVLLFTFIWSWTDFLGPFIFLTNANMWTLSIGLTQFATAHGMKWSLMMAATTIFVLPMVVLFLVFQKAFVEGISITGIKG